MAARGDLNGWWRFGIAVVGAAFGLTFKVRVVGASRIPVNGSAIVAGNHVSALDGVVLALVVGRERRRMTRYLTAAEFFDKRKFGWALRLYRQIPLRRGEGDSGALDEAVRTIRAGAVTGIFPEGKVNPVPEGALQRGRSGVGRIALATEAPVVPVGIWGTQRRWPHQGLHFRRPWRPVVVLAFGEPIAAEGDPASITDVQGFTKLVMERIAERVGEARRLGDG